MGLFDFFKKPKTDLEQYYEERNARMKKDSYGSEPAGDNLQFEQPMAMDDYAGCGFRITVEDVFSIAGRGTVITGRVKSGSVRIGETVVLQRTDGSTAETVVTGIEMFRKLIDVAQEGDNVGLLLRGLSRNDIGRGDVLVK